VNDLKPSFGGVFLWLKSSESVTILLQILAALPITSYRTSQLF